jgi:phage shock protein A
MIIKKQIKSILAGLSRTQHQLDHQLGLEKLERLADDFAAIESYLRDAESRVGDVRQRIAMLKVDAVVHEQRMKSAD